MSSVSQTTPGATQRSAREPLNWKSSSDVVIAGILMVLTAPLIFAAWVLVRLMLRGPGFYSQIRLGLSGRHFRIYKLRSMTHDCERETGPRWSTRGDSRVTPFGRFLRSTHIDELPQLLNILRGDMSWGPSPGAPEIAARLERALPCYCERLQIRPGVTGLAQVQLPPDTDLDSVSANWRATSTTFGRIVRVWTLRIVLATALGILGTPVGVTSRAPPHFLAAMWFRKPTATILTRWARFPTESSRLLRSIWPETRSMIFQDL